MTLYKETTTLTTSKHSIEFTYSDFPCNLTVNRGSEKGKRFTMTADSFTEIDRIYFRERINCHGESVTTSSHPCVGLDVKIPPIFGTNQIAGVVEFFPLTS